MLWSFFLAGLALVGMWFMWLIGNGRRWAWLGSAALGTPWLAYAASTGQWGFVPMTALSMGINVRNYWRAAR